MPSDSVQPNEQMKSDKYTNPFTARQQAAVLRLYVQQRVPLPETAKRLQLPRAPVVQFLQERGVLRRRGRQPGTPQKLTVATRQNLERELGTTMNVVLARKYGVSHERIRQIRQELGYPSSRVLHIAWVARARAKRREQEQLAIELRQQQRRAKQLLVVKRLSKRWKSGVSMVKLAKEFGYTSRSMGIHIVRLRREFPEKFPYRNKLRPLRHLEEVR